MYGTVRAELLHILLVIMFGFGGHGTFFPYASQQP
jgi:hypothetical protein